MSGKPVATQVIRRASVTDPKLDPSNHFTIYRVRLETIPVSLDEAAEVIEFYKRYSDFKKLETDILRYYKQLCRPDPFPTIPSPVVRNRFDEAVIEERRMRAELMLQFILEREYLYEHNAFSKFCRRDT
ncbi:unnamed protein product [Calicophoron daubneyi]|uniref:PX domain-containing protein n=1 Tax=Calicophoron daubneyi TaxID=300641 RepID=A0AAV2SYP1_CALDB